MQCRKLNVWAGILDDTIIVLLFFDVNLNGKHYLEMLHRAIGHHITHEVENQRDFDGNVAVMKV